MKSASADSRNLPISSPPDAAALAALAGFAWRVGLIFALLMALAAASVHAQQHNHAPATLTLPDKSMEAAIKPLQSMPVQDYGFIRSGYTFGENHLMAIAGRRDWEGRSPLLVCVWLMADHDASHVAPLIKVIRPEMVNIFGGKMITYDQYNGEANQQKFMELIRSDQDKWTRPANELHSRSIYLEELEGSFAIIPHDKEWLSPPGLREKIRSGAETASESDMAILNAWDAVKKSLVAGDNAGVAAASQELANAVNTAAESQGIDLSRLRMDVTYHAHAPFAKSAFFFLIAALFYGTALLMARPKLAWAGWALLLVGFGEGMFGIVARWILGGRAPLSNMYESFTFAIIGMVLVALIFELATRAKVAGFGSAILGFIFMVIAHKAPIFDSQIRPLMPALQSSWLTYHVVTIMLSYSAFALSFFVSLAFLAKDFLGGDKRAMLRRMPSLDDMDVFNYKIIAVGFPLLTIGIILGAVWAATAWGRPWGFDPKETWSAITWLVYAIYLHVRYLAGWKGRKAAFMAILGFACVLFTYLGVNYLLPGLHSYV